jgi:outer membrane protein, heavy metal efflux system
MRKFLLLSFFITHTLFSSAQEALLTIHQAVESAFTRNAELQQLKAQLEQKKNAWRLETGISAPEVSYFKEGIGKGPGDIFDEKRITVSQTFDFPTTGIYRIKALEEELKALEFQVKKREKEIKADIKSSYVEIIYAIRLQKSREHKLRILEDLHKAVLTKFESGMANGIDLVNTELQLDEARNDLDQSEWILHQARYQLFFTMGLPVAEQRYSIQFTDTLYAPDIAIDEIFALTGQENQPAFHAARHELNASRYFLKEAKSNILPDIRLNLYRQDYGSGFDFTGFEVGFSLPLWYPFEYKGKIQTTLARQEEILWKQNEIRLDMKRQIEHAWHNYEVSHKIVHRYQESMKSKASHLQTLSLRAYQLGEIDLLHLLNAQQTYLNGEERYLAAMRDYYQQLVVLEKFLEDDLVK